MTVDVARARALFGDEQLGWLIDRLRRRLERDQPLTGRLRLDDPTADERDALERLTGRRPRPGRSISIEVDDLAAVVAHAGIADDLVALVEAVSGPVEDVRGRVAREQAAWDALHRELRDRVVRIDPDLVAWADEVAASGALRRSASAPAPAARLVTDVACILEVLPAPGIARTQLAAARLGDSHALDDDRAVTALVLRAIEVWQGLPRRERSAAERRALWARVGVLTDELSAPVLVCNLPAGGDGLLARVLRLHLDVGEPWRITLGQLVRHPPDWAVLSGQVVSVCENPTVVAAAAARLGPSCAPLLCTDGQPSGAVQTLLGALREVGAQLRFHTDLDAGGVRIGNLLVDRFGAVPWRMSADDHAAAVQRFGAGGPALAREVPEAVWDPQLRLSLQRHGRAIHEEQVLDTLLADLDTARQVTSRE